MKKRKAKKIETPKSKELNQLTKQLAELQQKMLKDFFDKQNLIITKSILKHADPPIKGNTITEQDLLERNIKMMYKGEHMWVEQKGLRITPFLVNTITNEMKVDTPMICPECQEVVCDPDCKTQNNRLKIIP